MKEIITRFMFFLCIFSSKAKNKWVNIDSLFQPLPASMHVYRSTDSLDGKPNIMYYAIGDLKDKSLNFTTDKTYKRRPTPTQFYHKNNDHCWSSIVHFFPLPQIKI